MFTFVKKYKHWFLILLGTAVWSLTMVKSGLIYKYGMGFWGPNGHDGVWHLSLISELAKGSLQTPIFSGEIIKNYHVGFDLFVAILYRLTSIPGVNLYFQILPPIFALIIGFLTYRFSKNMWSLFFVYFGGSFGWLVSLIRHGNWGGESMFWSQQAISTLINPPFALSLITLLLGLISARSRRFFWALLFFTLTFQIKVYGGLLVIFALGVTAVYEIFIEHKFFYLKLFLTTSLLSVLLFLPLNRHSSSLIVFQPFWFLDTLLSLSDRFYWPRLYEALVNYRLSNNIFKFVLGYGLAFGIFILGNLGARIIFLKKLSKDSLHIFMYAVITAGVVVPMLFLQNGTPWNTIQFFYYTVFFSAILAGEVMGQLKAVFIILLFIMTIPTSYDTLVHVYWPSRPPAKISTQELDALNFLRNQPPGIVLAPVVNPDAFAPPPRPLYLYESTAYVSAFSHHPVFMEDEVNLNITGYDWPARRRTIEELFKLTDSVKAQEILQKNKIVYLYLPQIAKTRPILSATQLGMVSIFENSEAAIWKNIKSF